jgi:CRISPR-associated endonuclease/helicase Cas3
MTRPITSYSDLFRAAFYEREPGDRQPFDYQLRLATDDQLPSLVNVPTGAGKTAAVLGAWLWRRMNNPVSVGRRLIYCLPMRTLVEQTAGVAERAIQKLEEAGLIEKNRFTVHILMGGDVTDEWDMQPERECILIGTQDMLLSRALNRGYAMSRFRWPVHFGLLNNDCHWIFDEIQLMGSGLATSTQLVAFREQFETFSGCHTLWMSATLDREWLRTIDFAPHVAALSAVELSEADCEAAALSQRLRAVKRVAPATDSCRTPHGLAGFVKQQHRAGTQTLVVVNRVVRARETFAALEELYGYASRKKKGSVVAASDKNAPELLLMHSRFRPPERKDLVQRLNENVNPTGSGRITVATQVVEAGLDISSRLLITDLAPYASLVQRFGRCNRGGEFEHAEIYWVDRPVSQKDEKLADKLELDEKERSKMAAPYEWSALERACDLLHTLESAAPEDLPQHHDPYKPAHVLRCRDLVDLFDTTPDLSGYDLDISRFVRGGDERDAFVAWRVLDGAAPAKKSSRLVRDEMCSVPIAEFREFLKSNNAAGKSRTAWMWNALDGAWQRVMENDLRAGLTLLVDVADGGYDKRRGWDAGSKEAVEIVVAETDEKNEAYDDDPLSQQRYTQTLMAHSREARAAAEEIVKALDNPVLDEWRDHLITATHHHDLGKAHKIFQQTLYGLSPGEAPIAPLLAKSETNQRHSRPHFRHELASALALLQTGHSDLTIYLAASHHGKVRLSIRALAGETKPNSAEQRYARGIHEGESLEAVDLGGGVIAPLIESLSLEPMLLGSNADGTRSWLERMIALRDRVGVFRLAYLECLIRAADVRASKYPQDFWMSQATTPEVL